MADRDTLFNNASTPAGNTMGSCPNQNPAGQGQNGTGTTQPLDPDTVFPVFPDNMGNNNNGNNNSDNDYGIALPIAPPGGRPVAPVAPVPPTPSIPSIPSPGRPIFPNAPEFNEFSQTRFLVAATNSFPLSLSVDSSVLDTSARFGTSTSYSFVADGFHTVTVRRANDLRAILFQKSFPFKAGEKSTLVVVDSDQGGMDVIQVSDVGCRNLPTNYGCYRMANMSYNGSSYNMQLYNSGTVFRNVTYGTVTPYKQAMRGSYLFYVTNASCCSGFRELPIIAIGVLGSNFTVSNPLLSVQLDIQSGKSYTTYIIGNNWSDYSLRAITLED